MAPIWILSLCEKILFKNNSKSIMCAFLCLKLRPVLIVNCRQDGASARSRNFFTHETCLVGKKLSLYSLSKFETIYNGTLQHTGQDQYNRYSPVPYRYTIHQSTPHVLSLYRDHAMQGEGKKEIFPPTHSYLLHRFRI